MIRHIVMCNIAWDADEAELNAVMAGLGDLVGQIDGYTGFEHGPNRDFEAKSPDHDYGFVGTFASADSLAAYAADPRHQALGARLVALCVGGGDGIIVYDVEVQD